MGEEAQGEAATQQAWSSGSHLLASSASFCLQGFPFTTAGSREREEWASDQLTQLLIDKGGKEGERDRSAVKGRVGEEVRGLWNKITEFPIREHQATGFYSPRGLPLRKPTAPENCRQMWMAVSGHGGLVVFLPFVAGSPDPNQGEEPRWGPACVGTSAPPWHVGRAGQGQRAPWR